MEISAAQYLVLGNGDKYIQATINGEKLTVPLDNANRHYQAILEWVSKGNTIAEAD